MPKPTLFIFSGLPGTGKSTIAIRLARHTASTYLRIDTIEQAIRDLLGVDVQYQGYQLTHRIAGENLAIGNSVVADSCNPLHLTREDWQSVAVDNHAAFINVEIICSDPSEHKIRVESRLSPVPNLQLPTWPQVIGREYHGWSHERITLDTAGCSIENTFNTLLALLPSSCTRSQL